MSEFKIKSSIELNSKEAMAIWSNFKKETEALKTIDIKLNIKNIDQATKDLKNLLELSSKVANQQGRSNKVNTNSNELKGQRELLQKYKDTYRTIQKLQQQASKTTNRGSFDRTIADINRLKSELGSIEGMIKNSDIKLDLFHFKQNNSDLSNFERSLTNISSRAEKLQHDFNSINFKNVDTSKLEGDIQQTVSKIEQLQVMGREGIDITVDLNNALGDIERLSSEMRNLQEVDRIKSDFASLEGSIADALGIDAVERFRSEISQLESSVGQVDGSFDRLAGSVRSGLNEASSSMRTLNSETRNSSRFMNDFRGSFYAYTAGNVLGDGIIRTIRGVKDAYLEIDKGLTNVKKVANDIDINTSKKLENIKNDSISIAKEVGQSSADVLNAIADTVQAGVSKTLKGSMEVARQTMMLANVGELKQEDASSAVTTMIRGFNINPNAKFQKSVNGTKKEVTQLTLAMDALNYASNEYGTSAQQLIDGMQNGGNVLGAYGVTLNDTIGLMTSGIEVLGNGNKVGNGLKSIAMNLRGLTTSSKDGSIKLNKTALALSNIAGIDIYADKKTGQIKNMVQILDEVKSKWGDLSEKEQSALSTAIAGKQQASVFQAVMKNYSQFKKLQSEMNNDQHVGSMSKENAQYIDSISGKLNRLKETWVSIGSTLVKSDFTKGLLDGAIKISESIDKIIKSLDRTKMLTPLLSGLGFSFTKAIRGGFSSGGSGVSSPSNGYGLGGFARGIANDIRQAQTLGGGLRSVLGTTRNQAGLLGMSLKSAASSMLSFVGTGLLVAGVTYAIQSVVKAIDEYNRRYEIAAEKNKENIANIKDETKSLQEQKSRLSSISEEYDTLAKKSNKSNEEISRFNDLKKEIAEISPDLVAGADADGNPILALNGSLDDTIKKLEEAIRQKNELLKVQQNNLGTNETKNIGKTKEKLQSAIVGQVHDLLNEDYKFDKVFEDKAFADNSINAKLDRYKQSLEKKEQIVAQSNEKILEQLEEYNEKEAAIQQKAFNKLAEGKNYKGLKDEEIKGQLNSLTNDLNWGRFSLTEQNGIVSGLDKLAPILSKNKDKAKEWSDAMRDANTNFQASGDLEQYKKELQGTANELSKLTGISADTWIKGLMQEFGGLDLAKSKLHDFLKSYGSSTAELQKGNGFAITLQKQFQDLQGFMTDFTIDGKVNINLLKDIKNNKAFTDLPQQIKELISGVLGKDNKVTEVEQEVLLKISSSIEEKGKLSDDVSDKLNKLFQGKLSAKELKVPIKLANGMEIGTQQLGELNSLYAKNPVKVNFKAAGTPEEMLANVTKKLDSIKLEKDVKLKIEKGLAENDIGAVTEAINSLPEEKQVKVLAAIEGAYGNLNKVDKKKLKNKNLRLDAKDNATKTVNKVDKKKLKSKTTKISAKDNASKTINAIDRKQIKNKSFSIKVKTTFEKVMKTINETVRKATPKNQRGSTDSIATPSLSPVTTQSYSPIIHRANPVSAFSQAQPSPMATTQTSDATAATSSPSANLYSGGSSPRASVFASSSVSLKPTLKTPLALRGDDISNALNYDLDLLTELNNRIKIVTNSLAALDTKMDHAVGDEKIKYLREQNILFEQQKKLLKEQEDALIRHRNLYKDVLQRKGFKFNADNNMTNYEEKILALEKEHERLDKISSKEKSTDKQKNATEAAKKALDDAKKYAQEYFKVQMEELPNCKNEWDKLTNSIKDHNLEIKKLENDRWKNYTEATWTSMNRDVQEINNQLDMLDVLMKNAFGKDKNDMLQQKIDLLNKQKKEMGETTQQLRSVQNQLKKKAEGYGFKFRNDGTIENYIQQLDKLKNTSEEFDIAKDIIDEYMDVFMEKIPHAERELKELNNVIVETYKDKLEITSKIEDKITEMYKKQLEDRKKLINEELDAKVKSLDKQKKAYNDSRKNEEYKDDYEEQLKKVMDIQKKIDIAKRDTSESGKKKLKDLMKELEDNQKDLEKMVKDKTDSDVNDMFDNEKDRLEDVADKTIKDLEEKFSDSKIAELVAKAISSGVFTGIDGEISNLQDAITNFMAEVGELYGVQGKLIKEEVVGNLQIALDTFKNLQSIYNKLDINKFTTMDSNIQKSKSLNNNPYHITFNEPLMVVRGDITKDVLPEVKEMMKETEKRIVNNIAKNYKY